MSNTKTIAYASAIGVVALAICLDAAPAMAESRHEVSMTYHLDRAQLATPEGAAETYSDLVDSARSACRENNPRKIGWRMVDHDCVSDLVTQVVSAARAPLLTREHAGRNASISAENFSSSAPRG